MKERDVSVIVRNISISDTGRYECKITTNHSICGERVMEEFRHSIKLTDSGEIIEVQGFLQRSC